MIPQGLIAQIGMIIVSVGIYFSYIQPTFNAVSATNEQIEIIKIEREKVSSVNDQLNSLIVKSQELTVDEKRGMDAYLPAVIDPVTVQRDILLIAKEANIELTDLSADEVIMPSETTATEESDSGYTQLQRQKFVVTFAVPYQNLKYFLGLLELNNYPLYVRELNIKEDKAEKSQTNSLGVELVLETYGFSVPQGDPVPSE